MVSLNCMSLGMIRGMIVGPALTKIIKKIVQQYRVNKIVKELANSQKNQNRKRRSD